MHEALAIPRESPGPLPPAPSGIVLIGNPNVGKSAIFGALTGNYVTVSNYPGTTVEIARGSTVLSGAKTTVLDTPGTNSFLPASEDEKVTRDILLAEPPEAALLVGDAKNLERTLSLAVQLAEMDVPYVLCLNMMDETSARGIRIDFAALSEALGVAVVPTVATRREGVAGLRSALAGPRPGRSRVEYPEPIERALAEVAGLMPAAPVSSRSLAIMALSGDATIGEWLRERLPPDALSLLEEARQRLRRAFGQPVSVVVNRARMAEAARIARRVATRSQENELRPGRLRSWLEANATHPVWGIPILAAVLYVAYLFVGVLGAGTLVDLLENGLFGTWINPVATSVADRVIPWAFLRDLLVGPYGIVTMALTYSLALILPIVGTFFVFFGALEDSGYLPRLAVMLNRAFKKMGLNGKAVLPMVLGLGCDTMATLTTRILETRKERLIVIVLLALGVPCSAQLTVILAMLGSLSVVAMGVWMAVVVGTILLVGSLAAKILPGRGSDFILELPPLRVPQARNILVKTLGRIEWYLREAVPLFVLGTLILFVADRLNVLGGIERSLEPVLAGVLGLPKETAEAFLIGFLRRDFGAAGLYHMSEQGQLMPAQVVVAVVVITLFIPCIANFFMIVKERGWKTGIAIASFIFPFAMAVGAGLNWFLNTFPIPLR